MRCVPPDTHGGILNPITWEISVYIPTLQVVLCHAKRGHLVQPGALKHIETRNVYAAAYARGEFDRGVADALIRSIAVDFHPACFVR